MTKEEDEKKYGVNTNLTQEEKEEILEHIFSYEPIYNSEILMEEMSGRSLEAVVRMLITYKRFCIFGYVIKKVGPKLDWVDPEGHNLCFHVAMWRNRDWNRLERMYALECLHDAGFDCFVRNNNGDNLKDYLIALIEGDVIPTRQKYGLMVKTLRKVGYNIGKTPLYDIEEKYI